MVYEKICLHLIKKYLYLNSLILGEMNNIEFFMCNRFCAQKDTLSSLPSRAFEMQN